MSDKPNTERDMVFCPQGMIDPLDVDTVKDEMVAPGEDRTVTGIQLVGGMMTLIFADSQPGKSMLVVSSEVEHGE